MTKTAFCEYCIIFKRLGIANIPNLEEEIPDTNGKTTEDVWMDAISHISVKDFKAAMDKLALTCTFFPKPAEIIAAIPTNQLSGAQAWEIVQKQMGRCCGAPGVIPEYPNPIIESVVDLMGGLNAIWEDQWGRKNFIERYNEKISENRLLPGSEKKKLEGKDEMS
jgi:hypothetical protein